MDKLVKAFGYPKSLYDLTFDYSFMVRGLIVDKKRGNVIKVSAPAVVQRGLWRWAENGSRCGPAAIFHQVPHLGDLGGPGLAGAAQPRRLGVREGLAAVTG